MIETMVTVVPTDEFGEWFQPLEKPIAERVVFYVKLLEKQGVRLEHPYCSNVEDTKYPLRELRVKALGRAFRVFYAFDSKRQPVLLIGGEKKGNDKRFYKTYIPLAERIWEAHLQEMARKEKEEQKMGKGRGGEKE